MDIAIVPAEPEQAGILTEITIAAKRHWKYPERWIQFWLPALTITPEYILENETWVANGDGKPAGYYSFKQADMELWLDNLWVLPEYMGRGIGSRLFQHAVRRCRVREFPTLKIEADPNAVGFYERMGARIIGEHRGEVDGQARALPVMEIYLLSV